MGSELPADRNQKNLQTGDLDSSLNTAPSTDNQNDISSIITPRPPASIPQYIKSAVKNGDVERSMELLRQRRIMQQKSERVMDEFQALSDNTKALESPAKLKSEIEQNIDNVGIECEHSEVDDRVDEEGKGEDAKSDEIEREAEEETGDSYSPRII